MVNAQLTSARQNLPIVFGGESAMSMGSIPLFAALAEKMKWHQTRQSLLAENVANAEVPGYRGRDLATFSFAKHMTNASAARIETVTTAATHIVAEASSDGGFAMRSINSFEITPEGNGVTLEDEMMKITANQMDYQTATTLYSRSMRLLRTALGRQG
jgi:flagellar basal-body rod protein FlgB